MTEEAGSRMHQKPFALCLLASFLVAILFGAPAAAQDEASGGGEITISCPWFGVGGVIRPGEWAGLRLQVNDSSDKPREVIVRISIADSDSDKTLWESTLTTNPGVNQPVWMYVRLPASFRRSTPLKVAAFAALEGSGALQGDPSALTPGRQLGMATIAPRGEITSSEGILGIVGLREMGLQRYRGGLGNTTFLANGHERNEVISRLDPDTLPDRWMGLMAFTSLVWNEPAPSALNTEKSQAIREWVQRGGHLIVVLPRIGQAWTDEASNPLFDITPRVRINRREGASLEPLRNLITKQKIDSVEMPTNEVLQTMTPIPGASQAEAACIIAMPEPAGGASPEWLVARRQVGLGMVTMIGLDTASRWMDQKGLPEAELFWHRILGRRGLVTVKEEDRLGSTISASPITLDSGLADEIAKTSKAATGVLIGLVVFVLYWLLAGPLGYAALKKTGRQRHSWVAFVAAAAVFTGIAWGGATIIRPAKISAAHLTIMDHVYTPEGESLQRARSWMSVLIPQYGEASVAVGDPSKAGSARFHNLIAPWEQENASSQGFPDARGYRVNSRAPDHYTIPTRSTVKQFQVDWAGGPVWKMPRPVADASGKTIDLKAEKTKVGGKDALSLSGTLIHELPDSLRDVVIVVNLGQKALSTSLGQAVFAWRMTTDAYAVTLTTPWDAQTPLDLSKFLPTAFSAGEGTKLGEGYFGTLLGTLPTDGLGGPVKGGLTEKMRALAFFGALEPPPVEESGRTRNFMGRLWARRQATHGWDLSPWFTQPCIIVTGWIGKETEMPSPVPLMVDTGGGYKAVPTSGRTFVRWVYPLPTRPPQYPTIDEPVKTDDSPGLPGGPT